MRVKPAITNGRLERKYASNVRSSVRWFAGGAFRRLTLGQVEGKRGPAGWICCSRFHAQTPKGNGPGNGTPEPVAQK